MLLPLLARETQGPAIRQQLVSLRNWAPCSATAAAAGAASLRGAGAAPACLGAAAGQRRGMWGEPPSREEVMHRDSFYDNVRRWGHGLRQAVPKCMVPRTCPPACLLQTSAGSVAVCGSLLYASRASAKRLCFRPVLTTPPSPLPYALLCCAHRWWRPGPQR